MLQKWKLTKISFTKPHENITYKGSNKANAQHHKAICNRYYICYNTDMFSRSLESQIDFIIFKHGNHWKWSATYAHTLQWITLTLMKTEQTVSITLETRISLTTHTFDICFLFFLFLFVKNNSFSFFTFFLSLVITGIIECVVNTRVCVFKQEEHQHVHQDLQAA